MAILATLSLAAALACGGTVVGCGSNSSSGTNNNPQDSGTTDSGTHDTGTADTNPGTPDSGPADTGGPDTHVVQQLAAPTFTPPGPANVEIGSTVAINAPADLPTGGQLFYTTNGTVATPSSTLYIGPVQLTGAAGGTETVIAIAHDPAGNFADSPAATAVYTFETPDSPTLGVVTFNPPSESQNNDFLVGLSSNSGATICYTIDGNPPTCNSATGTCTGTSQTYSSGAGGISINGTVTNTSTGDVTVTAIACEAGSTASAPVAQVYQLIVADPTMVLSGNSVPVGTGLQNIPWPTGQAGLTPTVSTLTNNSIVVNDAVSIWYSLTPAVPTCITGTQANNPITFNGAAGQGPLMSTNTTYQAIGCKQGYLHSNVATFPLTIQLNSPTLVSATNPYNYELDMHSSVGAVGANTAINDSANDTLVGATTGSPNGEIICATTDGTAAACTTTAGVSTCNGTATAAPKVKNTGTTVNVVACAPGVNTSAASTATYTLQLAQPFLSSTDATGGGLGKPGWNWPASGLPVTSMPIPNGAATTAPAGYPYADGDTWDVSQVQQNVTACTGTAGAPEPTGGCGPNAFFSADYYCWTLTGTAACGATAGTCTTGTVQAVTTAGAPAAVLPGGTATGAGVTATSTLSIIACDNDAAGEDKFLPSAATNVAFSGAGTTVAPNIPAPANPYNVQAIVTVTNEDPTAGGSFLCATFDGSTPTCAVGGTCTATNAKTWCFDVNGNLGLASATTCVATPALGSTGNTVTIPAGLPGVSAPPGGGHLQTDGEVLNVIACNATLKASNTSTATYHFTAAEPDFTDNAGIQPPQTIGDLNAATSIGAGQTVNLSSISNFDEGGATVAESVHWQVGATANCGSAGVVTVNSFTQAAAGKPVVPVWFPAGSGAEPVAPQTGTTWQLSAVTCGQNDGVLQILSPVRTVTFNLAAGVPVITTNQYTGTAVGTCTSGASTTCAPQKVWENTLNAYLSSTTTGSSICYSTNGAAPSCAAGACGNGSTQTAGGPGNPIPITASGTNLQVLGCSAGLANSAPASFTFTLDADQAVVGAGSVTCGATTTVSLSGSSGPANADTKLGGPTDNACICYTTDGTAPVCVSSTCASGGSTTCFAGGATGINTSNVTITGPTTVNMTTCEQGFNPTNNSQLYALTPYAHTIIVDGNLSDWKPTSEGVLAYNQTSACTGDYWAPDLESTAGVGAVPVETMFTYDATNVYIGVNPTGGLESAYGNGGGSTVGDPSWTAITSNSLVFYLGTGAGGGATSDLLQLDPSDWTCLGARQIPAAAGLNYAILWNGTGGVAPGTFQWDASTLTWNAAAFTVAVGYDSGTGGLELGIALSAIGSPPVVTMTGMAIGDIGITNPRFCGSLGTQATGEFFRWPSQSGCAAGSQGANGIGDWFLDTRSSCLPPNGQVF